MNLRRSGALSTVLLASCQILGKNESDSVKVSAHANDLGNFIRITNDSEDELCIPSRYFNSKFGTLSVFKNGTIQIPYIQSEYGKSDLNVTFYVVPAGRGLDISIDFSQYKFSHEKYDYSLALSWYFCKELGLPQFSELGEKRAIRLRSSVRIPQL